MAEPAIAKIDSRGEEKARVKSNVRVVIVEMSTPALHLADPSQLAVSPVNLAGGAGGTTTGTTGTTTTTTGTTTMTGTGSTSSTDSVSAASVVASPTTSTGSSGSTATVIPQSEDTN